MRAPPEWIGFLLGRVLSYSMAGALLGSASAWAANVVIRGGAGPLSPWLTLWAMAHAAVLGLGLWLLWRGRQPLWLVGLRRRRAVPVSIVRRVPRVAPAIGASVAGSLWAMLPCGLLQSALVVAALASGPAAGAFVMAAFSMATVPGLVLAPVLRAWLERGSPSGVWPARLTRASGLMLALASAWTLTHGLWVHVRDYC